jgi:competence protein ComEA
MAALALVVALAFRFTVPFAASEAAGEALTDAQTAEIQNLEQTTRVDVNHAGLEELCTLPGVGEAKAQAILDYRARYGAFE